MTFWTDNRFVITGGAGFLACADAGLAASKAAEATSVGMNDRRPRRFGPSEKLQIMRPM